MVIPMLSTHYIRRHAQNLRVALRRASEHDTHHRLVHIEEKLNILLQSSDHPAAKNGAFVGHADQGFGHVSYAQHGEDMILVNIFEMAGIHKPTYIDIGAHHPVNLSNTALIHLRGSRGINIEANPNLIAEFHKSRTEDINLNVGVGPDAGMLDFYYIDDWTGRNTFDKSAAEAFVKQYPEFKIRKIEKIKVVTLDSVVSQYAKGIWPDFLSIDVEGWDHAILAGSSLRSGVGPKVICAEVVSSLSPDVTPDASPDIAKLLAGRGYQPYVRTLGNVFFLDSAIAAKMKIST